MRLARIVVMFMAAVGFVAIAFAADYPAKPVKVVVPYTAGSATDVYGRMVAEKLSQIWGQPVNVENIPGPNAVGAAAVAKAAPDGYTLLVHSNAYTVYPALYEKMPYDPLTAFTDIAPIARQPLALVVGQSSGIRSIKELIAAAKAKPGEMKFGSAGTGTSTHLLAEQFKRSTGIEAVHVPYKGGPEATADTIAGKLTFWCPPVGIALKGIAEGKLVALGVSGNKRLNVLPDVPTLGESGVAGMEDTGWWGVWAPAGMPPSVVNKLSADIAKALSSPELREKFSRLGAEPMSMNPAEFSKFVRSEREASARSVKAAGIKPQ